MEKKIVHFHYNAAARKDKAVTSSSRFPATSRDARPTARGNDSYCLKNSVPHHAKNESKKRTFPARPFMAGSIFNWPTPTCPPQSAAGPFSQAAMREKFMRC